MKKQSRTEVFTEIKGFANQFGFEVEYNAFDCKIIDSTHTVNFTIWFDSDFSNYADGYVNVTYRVTASIATMGGNPTGDDLKQMASIIAAAGNLINTLQLQQNYFESLTYTQYIEQPTNTHEEVNVDVERSSSRTMTKADMIEAILNDMARKQIKPRAIIDKEWKGWLKRQPKSQVEQIMKNRGINR